MGEGSYKLNSGRENCLKLFRGTWVRQRNGLAGVGLLRKLGENSAFEQIQFG